MASDKPTALEAFRDSTPAAGDNVILSSDEVRRIRSLLSNLSNDSEGEISPDISPDELSDKSGGAGPFSVAAQPPDTEGNDERVVIGADFKFISTWTKEGSSDEYEFEVPLRKGRANWCPGEVITSSGHALFLEEHVKELWDEDIADNFTSNSDPDQNYQIATLYMDFRGWEPGDSSPAHVIQQSQVDSIYHWAPMVESTGWIDNNDNPPPGESGSGPSDMELLTEYTEDIVILGHVMASTSYSSGGEDYPRQVIFVYGEKNDAGINVTSQESVVSPESTGALPVQITGSPTSGEYPVNIHSDGKHEPKTGVGTLEVYNITIDEVIPVDTWLSAYKSTLKATG